MRVSAAVVFLLCRYDVLCRCADMMVPCSCVAQVVWQGEDFISWQSLTHCVWFEYNKDDSVISLVVW